MDYFVYAFFIGLPLLAFLLCHFFLTGEKRVTGMLLSALALALFLYAENIMGSGFAILLTAIGLSAGIAKVFMQEGVIIGSAFMMMILLLSGLPAGLIAVLFGED